MYTILTRVMAGSLTPVMVVVLNIPTTGFGSLQSKLKEAKAKSASASIEKRPAVPTEVIATAYDWSWACTGKWSRFGKTASGRNARKTLGVAADTRIFPLGTKLRIEKVGIRVVDDRGGRIKGNRIDVRFIGPNSYKRAMRFGRQKLKVTVLYMPRA